MPPAKQFYPGVIDYNGRMSANYQSGRALSPETAGTWAAIVAPFLRQGTNTRILDLGAGTGRFSELFARVFEAQVVGVEPSTTMLAAADGSAQPKWLAYVAGSAEAIPLVDYSCDLAWLSQVWHHVRDHQACAHELHRIVLPGGHVLVRGTFGDQLDGFPTLFHFWPAARDICQQLPTIQHTVAVFEANGFVLTEHRRVDQTTAASLREFADRTRFRADSALALISDSAFLEGQEAIEMAAAHEHVPASVVEKIELLVFGTTRPSSFRRCQSRSSQSKMILLWEMSACCGTGLTNITSHKLV
jgi:ubiquinone/menaquinone biosynthesis C-methylase UbiE